MANTHLIELLQNLGIVTTRIDHAPVYTSEQASSLIPAEVGSPAKNLFLRDKKGNRHFLVMLDESSQLDLGQLAQHIGSTRLSFGSPERLHEYLGIEPGAVSPLALINDPAHQVELWVEEKLWQAESIQCHPLVNTATLVLKMTDLAKFLEYTGHSVHLYSC